MPTPMGVQVTINQADAQAGRILDSAAEFLTVLFQLGLVPTKTMYINPGVPSGIVHLVIGTKPPPG